MTTISPTQGSVYDVSSSRSGPTIEFGRPGPPAPRADPASATLSLPVRVVLIVGGSNLIGVVIAMLIWNGLGPGPVEVLVVGVNSRTGLPLTLTVWGLFGAMNLIAWIAGRRPGIGTFVAPLIVGFVIDMTVSGLDNVDRPDMIIVRLIIQLIGIGAVGMGAAAIMKSDLGAGPSELLTTALSEPRHWSEPRVRTGIELGCLTVGVMLGGPIGIGTGMFAVIIGASVHCGLRLLDRILPRL